MEYVSYNMRGHFLEMCDCSTICPCWLGEDPDNGACTGVFGWVITEGVIANVDVAGRKVISASYHTGNRDDGGQDVYLFVDDEATDEQFQALANAFTGRLGGPLGELAVLMGTLKAAERTSITISNEADKVRIQVDGRISGEAAMLLGTDGQVTELTHSPLSRVLGSRAEVGKTGDFRMDLGEEKFTMEMDGLAAMRGRFSYDNQGTLIGTT
ncbi:MAG: DUF1326 domain-containing protein [Stackebrandtia sp.]